VDNRKNFIPRAHRCLSAPPGPFATAGLPSIGCLLVLAGLVSAASMLAIACPSAEAAVPQIRLNSDTTLELQNEQQICVNPTNPDNVVACWRDFRLGYRQVGVGYSLDGGYTWTDFLIGGELPLDSDPVLTVDRDGTFYLVVLNYASTTGENQLSVHRSTTQGVTWEGPFAAVVATGSDFEDKEWIAVDRTEGPRSGDLYVSWARFYDVKIMCVRSTDRGETWSAAVRVSDPGISCQWPVPIVLANGDVLIAWDTYETPTISYDISTDGGQTWGTDRVLVTTQVPPQVDINGGITIFPYPSLALDESGGPRSGWVYCVYVDVDDFGDGVDIFSRRSTDHGQSWSAAVRINDDPRGFQRDQFHPWVTCDEHGILTAIWYDRRDDTNNYLWHIYMSRSIDGGVTWEGNVRITDVASSPGDAARASAAWPMEVGPAAGSVGGWVSGSLDGRLGGSISGSLDSRLGESVSGSLDSQLGGTIGPQVPLALSRAGLIGEYSGVAVRDNIVHPVWTDTRNGHQDTYASVFFSPAGINDQPGGAGELSLHVYPSPVAGRAELHLTSAPDGEVWVEILDAAGRRVQVLRVGSGASESTRFFWDGRDIRGRLQPAGVYFARLVGLSEPRPGVTRIVFTR